MIQKEPSGLSRRTAEAQARLRHEIAGGQFAGVDLLPSERDVAAFLAVSRTTLRKAVAGLVDEGLLRHRQGSGIGVVRTGVLSPERPQKPLLTFFETARVRGREPSSRALLSGVFEPTPDEVLTFGLAFGERVYRLSRLRLLDGVPAAVDQASLPARFIKGDAEPRSIYAALHAAGVPPVKGMQRWRSVEIPAETARLLEEPIKTIGLLCERMSFTGQGMCCERTRSFLRLADLDVVTWSA